MSIEAVIYLKHLSFEKRKTSTAPACDTFGHLVLLDYKPKGPFILVA